MLLLALGMACGEPMPAAMPHPPMKAAERSAEASARVPTFDQEFIDRMVAHHEGAIAMAAVGMERADHPELVTLASRMITSQRGEISRMKGWRQQWYGSSEVPGMDMTSRYGATPVMKDTLGAIERMKAAVPFDLAFLDAMIPHHAEGVALARTHQTHANHPEIEAMATAIIEDQTEEIAQMRGWRRVRYPAAPELASARD